MLIYVSIFIRQCVNDGTTTAKAVIAINSAKAIIRCISAYFQLNESIYIISLNDGHTRMMDIPSGMKKNCSTRKCLLGQKWTSLWRWHYYQFILPLPFLLNPNNNILCKITMIQTELQFIVPLNIFHLCDSITSQM